MSLDTKHLRAFLVLAETLHFGRAAERLGLAQSALSSQIRRLEDVIGGPLLIRGRRTAVSLSPAGAVLRGEASALLAHLARTERIAQLAAKGEAGCTVLGYVFSAAMSGTLSEILSVAQTSFPYMRLDASPMETPEQISAVADARLDAGIIRPRQHYPSGISAHVIHRDSLTLALSCDHPLASSNPIAREDLRSETFLTPQIAEASGLVAAIADLARQGGFAMPALRETSDFVTAASMAASGAGVVLAPRALTSLHLPGLVYREIADFRQGIELALIWHGTASPLVQRLLDHYGAPPAGLSPAPRRNATGTRP